MNRERALKVVMVLVGLLFVATIYPALIAFTAWSGFAHAVVMTILGFRMPSEQVGFLSASAVLVVIGLALLARGPAKQSVAQVSTDSFGGGCPSGNPRPPTTR
jgi:hypothetical protein